MADDLINRGTIKVVFNLVQRRQRRIVHPVALQATDMVVALGIPIEALNRTPEFQFLDLAHLDQNFKVAIDRSQADPWELLPDQGPKLVSAGMGLEILNYL